MKAETRTFNRGIGSLTLTFRRYEDGSMSVYKGLEPDTDVRIGSFSTEMRQELIEFLMSGEDD